MRRPRFFVLVPFAVLLVVSTLYSLASLVATLVFAYLPNSFSGSDSIWTTFWLSLTTCLVCSLNDYFVIQFVFRNTTLDRATALSAGCCSAVACPVSIALVAELASGVLSSVNATAMAVVCALCELSTALALVVGRRNMGGLGPEDARMLRVSSAPGSVASLVATERLSRLERQEKRKTAGYVSPYERIRAYARRRRAEEHPAVTRGTQKLVLGLGEDSALSDALDSYNQHPNLALEVADLPPAPSTWSKRPVPISEIEERPLFVSPLLKGLVWLHLAAVLVLQVMIMCQDAKVSSVPGQGPLRDAGALRRLRVYDYESAGASSGRYTASLAYLRFSAGSVPSTSYSNYSFIVLVHDGPLDHSELAPLAAELARDREAAGVPCTVLVPDRLGHGITDKGGSASPRRDAHVLQQLVLAEFYEQRTGRRLGDARDLAGVLEAVGATQEFLEERVRVACVGHGEGARVCEEWRGAHAAEEPHLPLAAGLVFLDHFPLFALGRALGRDALELVRTARDSVDWRRALSPLGVVRPTRYELCPRLEGEGEVPGGALSVADLNAYLSAKLPWAQDTALLWESKYELMAGEVERAGEGEEPESWAGEGVPAPVLLLGLSYRECQDGPSAVPCGLFEDDAERARALRAVQADLAEALAALPEEGPVASREYGGPAADLWQAPGALAREIGAFVRFE